MHSLVLTISDLAVLSALCWLFDVPYRQYRIDLLRHQLFGARDSLFAAARDGEISFSDPAYGMTRQIINGMIRFTHQVSVWQVLLMLITRRIWDVSREQVKVVQHLTDARSVLTSSERKVIDDVMNRAHADLMSHMAHTSLCLFPFVVVSKVIAATLEASGLETSGVALGNTVLDWVDCQAYVIGEIHA